MEYPEYGSKLQRGRTAEQDVCYFDVVPVKIILVTPSEEPDGC